MIDLKGGKSKHMKKKIGKLIVEIKRYTIVKGKFGNALKLCKT
jgi:hypothetical protein